MRTTLLLLCTLKKGRYVNANLALIIAVLSKKCCFVCSGELKNKKAGFKLINITLKPVS